MNWEEENNMIVTFLPENIEYQVQKEDNLLNIASSAKIMIDGNCGGKSKCGKCKVQLLSGVVSPPDSDERSVLTENEIKEGYRLACRLRVEDDLVVIVPKIDNNISRKTKLTWMPENLNKTHSIKKYFLKIERPSLENQNSDIDQILKALPEKGYSINPLLLTEIPKILEESDSKVTITINDKQIIAIESEDTTNHCYGFAFDIGTTTVVGMLWDLNKGQLIGASALTNPQSVFGADVISRIHFTNEDSNNLLIMKSKIKECFNDIIEDFIRQYDIKRSHIYEATVVGNTTMSHLFMGVDPTQLAQAPFAPVFCMPIDLPSKDMDVNINPLGNIHLLPNIAGHVGSDIVGVLLGSNINRIEGINLAIDVGTNGEIVLSQKGRSFACSTAAGPAFEGASIFQGMRAASGAIEGVQIKDGEVVLKVIGDVEPVGICGSGLIDSVAELLNVGIVDYTGKLLDEDMAIEKNIEPSLAKRLRKGKNGKEFVLAWGEKKEDIVITQKDIREVQLAKGAIYGGIVIMLSELGVQVNDLDKIILAGAFGNYIKKESALRIGLFPMIDLDKIVSVGNAAGVGASMALLSTKERKEASVQAKKVKHIELSGHPDFQTEYIKAMNFPKEF